MASSGNASSYNIVVSALKKISVWSQPLYSLDQALCYFLLFIQNKLIAKGKYFQSVPDTEVNMTVRLKIFMKEDF